MSKTEIKQIATVHEHILMRIAGLPFHMLGLNQEQLSEVINQIVQLERQKGKLKEELLSALHEFNKEVHDVKLQQQIQNYRRKLFNSPNDLPKEMIFFSQLSETLKSIWENLKTTDEVLSKRLLDFRNFHEGSALEERVQLQNYINNGIFLKGIGMASHSMLNSLEVYLNKDPSEFRKKEINTEKSILKYFSRTIAKTSPFSTLTNLGIASAMGADSENMITILNADSKVTSKVRINNLLQQSFVHALQDDRELISYFPISLNPSLKKEKKVYHFLINIENREVFQRADRSAVLDLLISCFETEKTQNFAQLISVLEDAVDAERSTLNDFLLSCIDAGIFEIELGFSGIDPQWHSSLKKSLSRQLKYVKNERVEELLSTVDQLVAFADQYRDAQPDERKQMQEIMHQRLKSTLRLFIPYSRSGFSEDTEMNENSNEEGVPGLVIKEQIFYEDSCNNLKLELGFDALSELAQKLTAFYPHLDLFNIGNDEKNKMYAYFTLKYPNDDHISLLRFYEDYYQDIKVVEKEDNEWGNRVEKERTKLFTDIIFDWRTHFVKGLNIGLEDEILEVSLDHLNHCANQLGYEPDFKKKRSIGGFIQVAMHQTEGLNTCKYFVVNSLFSGYGRLFSRFLHLFPDEVTEKLKADNLAQQPIDCVFAEIQDGSFHNANIHPSLLAYEIRIPGGHTSLPQDQQILVSDLDVCIDRTEKSLSLQHRVWNKRVVPFDLGFQSIIGRSELFKLLSLFTGADYNSSSAFCNLINKNILENTAKRDVLVFPRILLEKSIVLQRKTWIISAKSMPQPEAGSDEYYLEIRKWQQRVGLPDHVFLRLQVKAAPVNPPSENIKGRDDYKPQFIDFTSVLYVELLAKCLKKADEYIQIEEMLPDCGELLSMEGKERVMEFYIQMSNNHE
nr:lantibiotic dehydratase [uncultured Chryseobacterium sp.]